jgi:peptidoglycan/xylan/chitin deacetylase (PgdA/CDA1 family)
MQLAVCLVRPFGRRRGRPAGCQAPIEGNQGAEAGRTSNVKLAPGDRLMRVAATGIVILLVAVGCATPSSASSTLSPAPPTHSLPVATIAPSTPTPSPSPSHEITVPPKTPPPLAGSFRVVNSCDPASVPGAIPVAAPASPKAGFFTLYVPVLMYHRIVPFAESGKSIVGLVVPPQTFDAQLTALAGAGWHTITMATLADDLQAHVRPPAKTLVITLDDGWYDGFTYALPILQKHDFVATYYVIAGQIDKPPFLSSPQLQALVAAGNEIGDHTMDHFDLAGGSAATRRYQVDAAAARIAQVTGRWPESLAYPFGGENAQALASVAACQELRIAVTEGPMVTTKPGASQTPRPTAMPAAYETWANRFIVPRIRVTPGTRPAVLLGLLRQP